MKKLNFISITMLLEYLFCWAFLEYTKGLRTDEGIYVTDLQSSGGEDNIAFEIILLIYGIMFFIFIIKKWGYLGQFILISISTILFLISLTIIQTGNFIITIIEDVNIFLLFILLIPIIQQIKITRQILKK